MFTKKLFAQPDISAESCFHDYEIRIYPFDLSWTTVFINSEMIYKTENLCLIFFFKYGRDEVEWMNQDINEDQIRSRSNGYTTIQELSELPKKTLPVTCPSQRSIIRCNLLSLDCAEHASTGYNRVTIVLAHLPHLRSTSDNLLHDEDSIQDCNLLRHDESLRLNKQGIRWL